MSQQTPRSVALHLGAHKTATTHLQRSFMVQQGALNHAGIRYYGPDTLRRPQGGLGNLFGLDGFGKTHPTRSRAAQTDFMFKDGHRLVLSDENFVGVLHNHKGKMLSPLYPKAEMRVLGLSEALNVGPIDVMIGVRNPATFLVSAYGQALLGGQMISFDDYIIKNPLSQIYWPGLIARMRQVPNVGRIVVWRYEEYRWRFHKICAALMGDEVKMRILPLPKKVHRGLSGAAVAQVLEQMATGEAGLIGDLARKAFPVGDTNPPFAPFSVAEAAAATADYDQQIADIERIDGVTVLHP